MPARDLIQERLANLVKVPARVNAITPLQDLTDKLTSLVEIADHFGFPTTARTIEGYLRHIFANERDMRFSELTYYNAIMRELEQELKAARQQVIDRSATQDEMDQYMHQLTLDTIDALKRQEELDVLLKENIRKQGTCPAVVDFGKDEQAYKKLLRERKEDFDLAALKERNRRKAMLLKNSFGVKRLPEASDHGMASKIFDGIKNFFNVYADPNHTETDMQNAFMPMLSGIVEFVFGMFGKIFKGIFGEKRAKEVDNVVGVGKAMMNGMMMNAFEDGRAHVARQNAQNTPPVPPSPPTASTVGSTAATVTTARNYNEPLPGTAITPALTSRALPPYIAPQPQHTAPASLHTPSIRTR